MNQHLVEMFGYELWATQEWLAVIDRLPFSARASEVCEHHLKASRLWFGRSFGEEELPELTGALAEDFAAITAKWQEFLKVCDVQAYANWERDGEVMYELIEVIANHVVNHGTYHRGHLRGLCESAGFDGFPETDFIRYHRLLATK